MEVQYPTGEILTVSNIFIVEVSFSIQLIIYSVIYFQLNSSMKMFLKEILV